MNSLSDPVIKKTDKYKLPAYGITRLTGKANLNGWQWIFLLEGLFTIVLGVLTWFFIPDFPDKARFISEKQREVCSSHTVNLIFIRK